MAKLLLYNLLFTFLKKLMSSRTQSFSSRKILINKKLFFVVLKDLL